MKKRILSLLLCLILCLSLLPTAALAEGTNSYTVIFDANGGTGTMADVTVNSSSYTLPAFTFTHSDSHVTFAGWNTKPDGSGTCYQNEATIDLNGNITLYAQWVLDLSSATSFTQLDTTGSGYTWTKESTEEDSVTD